VITFSVLRFPLCVTEENNNLALLAFMLVYHAKGGNAIFFETIAMRQL